MTTMLIIDDEYYIRLGIRNAIDWEAIDVSIIGEAEDGEQGLELILKLNPDLILMDIRMPFLDGLQLMEKLAEHQIECGIIILSGYDEFEYAQKAIKNGVIDYLLKPIEKEKLLNVIANASKTIHKRKSTHRYQKLIAQEISVIQMQFLRDLIVGKISSEAEILGKLRELEISLDNDNMQIMNIKVDDYQLLERQLSSEEIHTLRKTIEYHLSENLLLSRSFTGILVEIAPDEWAVLLSYLANVTDIDREKELRQSINRTLKELNAAVTYTVSLSVSQIYNSVTQICQAYKTARIANKKFIPATNSVVYPNTDSVEGIRPEVQEAVQYIKQHFNENITIQAVAEKLYLSPSYLMHIFKNDLGKTFNTFLTDYRIEVAKELLQAPGSHIYEIAKQVGYQDVKYFNKVFKRYTELNPSDYVRLHYALRP